VATRSAEKAHRQSLKRHLRNRAVKSATKTAIKQANAAIMSHDINAARDATRAAIVALDKAAQKGVLHANNAARHKSRLLIKYNAAVAVLQTPGAEVEAPKKRAGRKAAAEGTTKAPKRAVAKKATARKTTKK
jgi:small subunit ribosomal protein S20